MSSFPRTDAWRQVCDTVEVGVNLSLACQAGVISSISFAAFGTPSGRCGSFGYGTCNMNATVVQQRTIVRMLPRCMTL